MRTHQIIRYSLMAVLGMTFLAGCLDDGYEPTPMDIQITNLTNGTITVDITLTSEEGYGVFSDTITMNANSNMRLEDVVKSLGVYDLSITVDGGRTEVLKVGVGEHLGIVGVTIDEDDIMIGQKVE
ncbi:MAG: hypothetical protein ACMUIE_07210 [Thermoplasmatota archaeon]